MVDTARPMGAAPARPDAMVQAVAFAAERLLLASDWREVLEEVLAHLGVAAGVSRAYVVRNDLSAEDEVVGTWLAEWTAPGVLRVSDDPRYRAASWESGAFRRWAGILGRGDAVTGAIGGFPEAERAILAKHGVASLASFPLSVEGAWWGAVGFDDCVRERDWAGPEAEMLRTAATLLEAAIERERQEARLRATEARYRSVVEQIPAVTYFDIVGDAGVHLGFVSPQIEQLLGYHYERFLEEPEFWFTLIHPDDDARIDEAARASGKDHVAFDDEYRMRHADGRWVWVHDTTTPVLDDEGELTHFQGFLLDVTARREAEERLREAEERYRAVVEGIPAASYIDEPADTVEGIGARVTYMSPQIEEILGIEPRRFLDAPGLWFQLMHPDDYERLNAAAAFDVSDETPFDQEYRMRHADGRWIWVRDTSIAIHHADGSLAYFQGFMVDVTERVEAERSRAEAEARYRSVVESIAAVTYVEERVETPDGPRLAMTFVSPQVERLTGVASERFLGDQAVWYDLMHPDDLAALRAEGRLSAEITGAWDAEYRMRGADGAWIWVHDATIGIWRDDGTLSHLQGWVVDVTARHDAEEHLRQAQERFRVLVEQMPAIVYTETVVPGTTKASRTDYVSPAVEVILGYPAQAWIDDVDFWENVVHPDDAERVTVAIEHVNATGDPLSIDYRIIAADGRTVWIHEESLLIRDEDGAPSYWQGLMLDVTERTIASEQIQLAQERFRMIVEHTPAITYQELPTVTPSGPSSSTSYVSPQAERLLGYPIEAWHEPGFWERVLHPDDLQRVIEVSSQTNRDGSAYRQDYRVIAADGRTRWFHDEAEMIRDANGVPIVWQGVLYDITDRMEAEEQLRQARARLQALIDHIPAAVYIEGRDAAPDQFYISPQVEEMFGYSAEEWTVTEDFWVDRIHPDDREAVTSEDARSDDELKRYTSEYRFRRADGTYIWVHDEAAFVADADGRGFWQGFLYDITDRKQSEQDVAAAERVLRATVEHLPAVVYREPPDLDDPSTEMYISPQIEDLLGYGQEEWLAGSPNLWIEHLHPDDREHALDVNARADATKAPFALDYRLRRKDGSYVWIHDEATFVESPGGEGWWQGFLLDITARKEAEQLVQAGEAKFRAIVEQSPAVIYTQAFDQDEPSISKTTYISPKDVDLFGYSIEETLADPTMWARTIHPDDRERVLAADLESNRGVSDSFLLEYRMIAKDGRVVWVQDQANLVRVEGQPPFWQGFLLDITERKAGEEQLARALEVEREATRSLRALDEMKNTFLQAVSHDLRTPLAAILGLAITLERGDVHLDEDDAKDLAHRIAGNARRLDRLVANLLDLDRLARGIVTPKLQSIDVGALVERVLAESELVPEARLRLQTEPIAIPVDASKVERIVENLVANTIRHTPEDSRVFVRVLAQDGGCLIAVEDDGPGIPEEMREAIFEPFRQGSDAPEHSPGVGVGLTLVRRFAELHGGSAWVQDRDGGGASFRVFLPSPAAPAEG